MEALNYAKQVADEFKLKADHNKRESLWCIIIILGSSLSAPIFITLGATVFLSKIIPSILSVLAAGLTSWLQLRKPQKLWSMYRETQRLIEDQITKFNFKIGDYKHASTADSTLAEEVAMIRLSTHFEWKKVVPTPESIQLKEAKQKA